MIMLACVFLTILALISNILALQDKKFYDENKINAKGSEISLNLRTQVTLLTSKILEQEKRNGQQNQRISFLAKQIDDIKGRYWNEKSQDNNYSVSLRGSSDLAHIGEVYELEATFHCQGTSYCRAPEVRYLKDGMPFATIYISFAGRECMIRYSNGSDVKCPPQDCRCIDTRAGIFIMTLIFHVSSGLESSLFQCEVANDVKSNTIRLHVAVGGATYVHWGKTECGNLSEKIYTGFSSWLRHNNTEVNMICQPGSTNVNTDKINSEGVPTNAQPTSYATTTTASEPCSVCRSLVATSVVMVPGRIVCNYGWNVEYRGYYGSNGFETVCLDKNSFLVRKNKKLISRRATQITSKTKTTIVESCAVCTK